jgi:hypothetical protein
MNSRDARRAAPALLLVAGLVAVVAGTWWQVAASTSGDRTPQSPVVVDRDGREAAVAEDRDGRVLSGWDRRRAAAYSRGDVGALRSLYLPGSGAGVADMAVLRAWLQRGLRVEGLRTQVLARRVLVSGSHRLVLRVTDRVVGGVAVRASVRAVVGGAAPGGTAPGVRARLPADRPGERTVTLVRHEGRWVVARVV